MEEKKRKLDTIFLHQVKRFKQYYFIISYTYSLIKYKYNREGGEEEGIIIQRQDCIYKYSYNYKSICHIIKENMKM